MKHVQLLSAALILGSCAAPKIYEMTAGEKRFTDSLSVSCDCKATIEKDYAVEYEEHPEGIIYLELNYNESKHNYCMNDSIELMDLSQGISRRFAGIMSNKQHYKSIAINFYSSGNSVSGMETPTCDRTFIYDIAGSKLVDYLESNRK
ncbi:MAG: hypothetical protein JWO09_3783 [Bacteroidetes bacterium]|nr:hypothetical protein [Bacteroidota bacterium]